MSMKLIAELCVAIIISVTKPAHLHMVFTDGEFPFEGMINAGGFNINNLRLVN